MDPRSTCLGDDSPNASSKLAEEYEKLVEMSVAKKPFPKT